MWMSWISSEIEDVFQIPIFLAEGWVELVCAGVILV